MWIHTYTTADEPYNQIYYSNLQQIIETANNQ